MYGHTSSVNGSVLDALIRAERIQWNGIEPSIVFLVDRSDESFHNPDHVKLRKAYEILYKKESDRHPTRLIRNDASVDESVKQVLDALRDIGFQPQNGADGKHVSYSMDQPQLLPPVLRQKKLPYVFAKLSPARPTVVYDSYWRFAAERQEVFFRKLEGLAGPWTDDPILHHHKFTNAYRASDRVSQYLIRHVIYEGDPSPEEVLFPYCCFQALQQNRNMGDVKVQTGNNKLFRLLLFRVRPNTLRGHLVRRTDLFGGLYDAFGQKRVRPCPQTQQPP